MDFITFTTIFKYNIFTTLGAGRNAAAVVRVTIDAKAGAGSLGTFVSLNGAWKENSIKNIIQLFQDRVGVLLNVK